MNLNNLILHITIPQGIKTVDGATLLAPVTFDVASALSPFYASVDQVKLMGGYGLRKLSDLTIAAQIYMASKAVDMMNYNNPKPGALNNAYQLFINSRNQWVTAKASMGLLLNIGDLLGNGGHVLANFSVTRTGTAVNAGTTGLLTDLSSMLKLYDPSIRSGGRIEPGGHARPIMAAKGVGDRNERTPGRMWDPNSVGANAITEDMGNSVTGGRGKPVSYYNNSIYSPALSSTRVGSYQCGMSLDCRNTCMGY
ncbi:MAG: hypothetical protein ACRYGG_11885 [Janthinobacterium lividum]